MPLQTVSRYAVSFFKTDFNNSVSFFKIDLNNSVSFFETDSSIIYLFLEDRLYTNHHEQGHYQLHQAIFSPKCCDNPEACH